MDREMVVAGAKFCGEGRVEFWGDAPVGPQGCSCSL